MERVLGLCVCGGWVYPGFTQGLIHESFADILKGLSGAKIISHGSFKSHNKGYSVRTSLKAEEGYLYPLEKAFFFLPKPPTLIPYEEVRAPYLLWHWVTMHQGLQRSASGTP